MKTQTNKILFGILCVFSGIGLTEATLNPPIAVVTPTSQTATVGQTVFFADGGSYDPDYGQTIVARAWTFPSQAVMINNYDSTSTYCKFNAAGTFTVNLKVQDNTGQWSTTGANCTVTVTGSVSTWYVSVSGDDVTNNGQTSGAPFHRIQTAIDCASNGHVIEVAEGTYYENIHFRGKDITVKSSNPDDPTIRANTVIDGNGNGTVVSFDGTETSSAILKGITIRGGGTDTEQFKAHWSFDSNAEDSEGNHDGTFNGNAIITTATGQHIVGAGALSLDGDNDYVQVGSSNDLNFGAAQDLSVSAWIKTSYSAGNQRIVFKKNDSFEGYTLTVVATTGKARLNVKGLGQSTATYVDSTTTVTDGQWHHLVGVRDADANIKIYVDGLLEATVSTSTMDLTNSFPLYIGIDNQYGGLTNDFNGKIDDVRIYGRALSAEDIRVLMMSTKIVSAAHWKLDEGTGTTAGDSSGNNHSLPLPNSPYQPTWTGGILDSSLNFDGTDDYVEATGYTGISGTNARTTAAWIRTTDTIGPIVYWGDKDTTGGLWDMRVSSTGKLRVLVAGGPAIDGSTTINTGQWVHVAAVLPQGGNNTNQILLYVNGVLETGTTVTAGTINTISDAAVRMGANETGHYYAGQIDDIRIYSEALSAERVRALASFPGPEAHWKLDETSGTTAPDSGPFGYTGTLQNMDGNTDWVQGVSGNSLDFDGTDDYVAVTNYTGISGSRARTTAAWIKTTDTIGPIVYWGNKDATGGLWDMRVSNTGKLRLLAAGGPAMDGSTTINTGRWVHVAAVLPEGKNNAGDILLYVNGVLETGVTVTAGTINTVAAGVRIGANETTHYFAGQMDEVRIYRRALSAAEIRELARGGGGIRGFGTAATINRCVIKNNVASMDGGGIYDLDGTISNCLIVGNDALNGDGMAKCDGSIVNCTIANNSPTTGTGLVDCTGTIKNCIIWNHATSLSGCSSATITYCDIQHGVSGTGNLPLDPNFIDSSSGDFHLDPNSPCIDAGDPASDYSLEPTPNGERINLGVYGNTPEATTTIDSDGDGLSNPAESRWGTDPIKMDTDDDGLMDGEEVNTHGTNPLAWDSDGDDLPDGWEVTNNLRSSNKTL